MGERFAESDVPWTCRENPDQRNAAAPRACVRRGRSLSRTDISKSALSPRCARHFMARHLCHAVNDKGVRVSDRCCAHKTVRDVRPSSSKPSCSDIRARGSAGRRSRANSDRGSAGRAMVARAERAAPPLRRIVVAVDPPAPSCKASDASGLIAAARGEDDIIYIYVLADESAGGLSPAQWTARAIALWHACSRMRWWSRSTRAGHGARGDRRREPQCACDPGAYVARQVSARRAGGGAVRAGG